MIKCTVGGHEYATAPLYFEDFTKLGFMLEEKIFPFLTCLLVCLGGEMQDSDYTKALYSAGKDVFNRADLELMANLVLNREHLLIDGKKLDNAEWQKHWQTVGYVDYRIVVMQFIKANLGNFSSLSALIPKEWTLVGEKIKKKFLKASCDLNEAMQQF